MAIDFRTIFSCIDINTATRVERFDEFEFFIQDEITQAQAHVVALALLGMGSSLPARDRFEVTISVDGEAASASDDCKDSRSKINQLFDLGSTALAEVGFRIIIRKQMRDDVLTIYDLEAFGQYLYDQPLKQVLDAISSRLNGHIKLVCSGLLKPSGSATIQFLPEDYLGPATSSVSRATRERTTALFKENSFSASLPATLIPLDFQLNEATGQNKIDNFFVRASAVLSAAYLCNNLELELDNSLTYRLAGYKVLEEKRISQSTIANAQEVLSKIANWAYDAGGSTDKVGLARNVLSLHVSSLPELSGQPHVLSAILSNYQIYLKDNISSYLDIRNRMAELLSESTAKTSNLVESLLDSVRNGILVVFTFLLTVVVVNGLKDTNAQVIFSAEYLWIVITIAVLYSIWIQLACQDAVTRVDSAARITKQLLRDSYRSILIEDEVDLHTNATFEANKAHLKSQVKTYQRMWYLVSFFLVAAFAIGHLISYQIPKIKAFQVLEESSRAASTTSPSVLPKGKSEHIADFSRLLSSTENPPETMSVISTPEPLKNLSPKQIPPQ